MPSSSPALSRVLHVVLVAGTGALAWWALMAGANSGRARGQSVGQALKGTVPGVGKGNTAPVPISAKVRPPVAYVDYREILRQAEAYTLSGGASADEKAMAFMDSVLERLGFSCYMADFMNRADVYTDPYGDMIQGFSGPFPRAVERALRGTGSAGAAWRAELVAALQDGVARDPTHRQILLLLCSTAGQAALPEEYARLREALAGDVRARAILQEGQDRVRILAAPAETFAAIRNEWLAAPADEDGAGTSGAPPTSRQEAWQRIRAMAHYVPPGADYPALDAILTSIPVNETQNPSLSREMEMTRADVLAPWALADPATAATWLASRPEGLDEGLAAAIRVNLMEKSPAAVSAWVNAFPAGATRDAQALSAVRLLASRDDNTARALADGIAQADLREQALAHMASLAIPLAATKKEPEE